MESSKAEKNRFAFVIPVYNHEEMVCQVIEQAREFRYPIILINDGSTDRTPELLSQEQNITVIHHAKNKGKGAALKTGFEVARHFADWAITVDADGQHDLNDVPCMTRAIHEWPAIIVGVRKGMEEAKAPWTSRFGRSFSNFWVFLSGAPWIKDTQSGFRIYPLPLINQLQVRSNRYQFEVEVLAKASWAKIPIFEVPVTVSYTPGSKRVSHFRPFVDFMRNSAVFTRLITQRILLPRFIRKKKAFIQQKR